ncbi:MAG: aldehyde dehydrogenase, partial [Pirellula sp.]|nr:aldehyde dehydrogenase [Pirellula sp.]
MQVSENLIRTVVEQVINQVRQSSAVATPASTPAAVSSSAYGRYGLFLDVDDAVRAARAAFEELRNRPIEHRRRIIDHIRRISIDNAVELGTMEMNETKIGRLEHKIAKLKTLGEKTPGVEFLKTECYSGDHGLAVIEHAPFGVIGAITPVTHSLPTITGNAVSMIASGNAVVVNPHPSGKKVAAEGVRRFNQAIHADLGIDNLISLICEPTLESAQQLFKHRSVSLICVTGGPAVARAALNSGKRAVVAGPGNPPVVVDETADLDRAARCIIDGASFDNNLLCIAEKQVFVVASVFDAMMSAMERAGAVRLNAPEVERLTHAALAKVGEGNDVHYAPKKELLGQDAHKLAAAAGKSIDPSVLVVFGETTKDHPFVQTEQMMPFLPFVRCRDFDEAVALAQESDQDGKGNGHHALRQEWTLHGRSRTWRGRLPVVLHRRTYRRRRDDPVDLHARETLLADRRFVHPRKSQVGTNEMQAARVLGNATSTVKHRTLENLKLLICQPLTA